MQPHVAQQPTKSIRLRYVLLEHDLSARYELTVGSGRLFGHPLDGFVRIDVLRRIHAYVAEPIFRAAEADADGVAVDHSNHSRHLSGAARLNTYAIRRA